MRATPPAGSAPPADPGTPTPDARRRVLLAVGGVLLLALVLRLPTAGDQSFWLDEVYTGRIVDGSLGHVWSTIQRTENTPPLFYLLDWLWSRPFGTGEFALRSLSAVVGALSVVPVVLLARRVGGAPEGDADEPTGRRSRAASGFAAALRTSPVPTGRTLPPAVAVGAGVLLAVNPLAQWFSQEARSYALFVLLAAVGWILLLAAAERPTSRRLWAWAGVAVLVAWTHYFGGLLVVVGWAAIAVAALGRAEDGRLRALRPLLLPAGTTAVLVAALAPIAANQQSTDMYQAISLVKGLGARIVELPKQFAIGYSAPAEYVVGGLLIVVLGVLVLAAAWPRDGRATRATVLLGLVAALWVLPMLGLIVGFDVVLTRNFVLLIPPLTVLAALGAWRLGRRAVLALSAVAVVQLATIVLVAVTPVYQREDWRGLMRAATDVQGPELVLVDQYQGPAATYYAPTVKPIDPRNGVSVRSMAIVDRLRDGKALEPIPVPPAYAGFRLVRSEQRDQWRVFVWEAPAPVLVSAINAQALHPGPLRSVLVRP